MKKINNYIKYLFSVATICIFVISTSCETTNLDVNVNPNALSPASADPNLVLNTIQAGFIGQSFGINANVRGIMRHINMFDTYAANTNATNLNGTWATSYSIVTNRKLIEDLNQNQKLANHLGVAQVIEAFTYVNLVDIIGTAPYSEAVNPDIANPNFDAGKDIYDAMYTLLDKAIANLQVSGQLKHEDLFFNGDLNAWVKLANTLKIRMYIQSKLVGNTNATNEINNIIASGNYIKSNDDDFVAQFGTNNDNPDIRHPNFQATYEAAGAGGIYMSNEFMNILLKDKRAPDPRIRHYIYRQSLADPLNTDKNVILPCEGKAGFPLCYIGDAYWGRQHADDEGIPNDNNLRSSFGAYPSGGAYDDQSIKDISDAAKTEYPTLSPIPVNPVTEKPYTESEWIRKRLLDNSVSTNKTTNLGGAGIFPVITASFTNFLLAEASLPAPVGMGVNGSSWTYLENAMKNSFAKVSNVTGVAMVQADMDAYINEVKANFNNAATDSDKLAIIIKEFYIASFGNSIEAYNAYRRTGFPDLGGSVITNGDFPRNFLIPDSEINTNDNPNVKQISRTTQVFWDTNPAGFVQ